MKLCEEVMNLCCHFMMVVLSFWLIWSHTTNTLKNMRRPEGSTFSTFCSYLLSNTYKYICLHSPQRTILYSCFLNPTIHCTTLYWPLSLLCIAGLCLPLHVSGQVVVERLGCYLAAARAVGGLPGLDRAPLSSRWTRRGYSDVLWTFHHHYHHTRRCLCCL